VKPSQALGAALTVLGVLMFLWGLVAGLLYGGIRDLNASVMVLSLYPILLGPWLWFGEVPAALKRFVEAKIEKSALEKVRKGGA